jgi:hypothetical protein
MKSVSLRREHTNRQYKFDKPPHVTPERFTKPIAVTHQIHTYTELQKQIHDDLRIQHPDWVNFEGSSPTCDSYEARLKELLGISTRTGSNESIAAPHHALEQGTRR